MSGKSFEEVMQRFREIEFHETFDIIVAIANGGIIPAAILNQRLNTEIMGKTVLLVEDRIKTGATVQFAIDLLQGARQIKTFAVNGNADYALYNEDCFKFPWIV